MIKNLKSVFQNEGIRKKLIATMLLILVYKILATIPIYGADSSAVSSLLDSSSNRGLKFFSSLMGGGLQNFSVILMGLSPYINALIIIQLLGVIVPKIGELQKEGESGQRKINRATRWLTLPLAFAQSYGMILLVSSISNTPIIDISNTKIVLMAMIVATAGTIFLMWLGEVMTEYGIGNGISLVITAGVLSGVPGTIGSFISIENYALFFGILVATLVIIYIIIKFTEGYRRIPVIYSKTGMEEKSYFPIRVNQAGMVPIIFAVSIITFPSIIGQIMSKSLNTEVSKIGNILLENFNLGNPSWIFIIIYFILVLAFSFFYVSITFNTDTIGESIQKRSGYIPGIRPGQETSQYLGKVSSHLNLFGGSFLALIAVLPYIVGKIMNTSIDFIISAAGLIIIVSVMLDIYRKIDAELKMQDYSKYY